MNQQTKATLKKKKSRGVKRYMGVDPLNKHVCTVTYHAYRNANALCFFFQKSILFNC